MTTEPKHTPTRFADQTELRNWLSSVVRLEYNGIENRYKFPSNDLYDLLVAMNTRHESLTGLVGELTMVLAWLVKLKDERPANCNEQKPLAWNAARTILTKAKALQPAAGK